MWYQSGHLSPAQQEVGLSILSPGGIGYNAENIPIKVILCVIYRIPLRQVVGGPDWLSNERFDVQVRADRPYSIDDLHIMFQNALADRFNLKLHIETKTGPVYVLTVAKSGLKMVPVDPGKDRNIPIVTSPNHESVGSRVPMNYLCFWLGQNLQSDQRQVCLLYTSQRWRASQGRRQAT